MFKYCRHVIIAVFLLLLNSPLNLRLRVYIFLLIQSAIISLAAALLASVLLIYLVPFCTGLHNKISSQEHRPCDRLGRSYQVAIADRDNA